MRELVLELMGEYGNLAVFLLILVENLFPPIPSEVILTFGGVMTVCTDMTPVGVILFSTAGSLAGAVILYSVGRFLPDEVFRKLLCGQIGHLLHFRLEDVDLAKGWFRERGRSAVFLCRLIPIVRSLISIPAGIARKYRAFCTNFKPISQGYHLYWKNSCVGLGKGNIFKESIIRNWIAKQSIYF